MGGGNNKENAPTETPVVGGIKQDETASAQEATPVPWLCGQRRLAVRWISRVYNQYTVEAPPERPTGKK